MLRFGVSEREGLPQSHRERRGRAEQERTNDIKDTNDENRHIFNVITVLCRFPFHLYSFRGN